VPVLRIDPALASWPTGGSPADPEADREDEDGEGGVPSKQYLCRTRY
jgi:hypothetical protein